MEEYFTREEAVKLCLSFQHLVRQQFTSERGITYDINFIVPVPANKEESDEFRDLLEGYLRTGDRTELFKFDVRERPDEFIPALFGRAHLKGGTNLLCVFQCQFVDQEGRIQLGFEVSKNHWML